MEQAHGKLLEPARPVEAGIADGADVMGGRFSGTQTFASNIVLDLIDVIDQFGARIVDRIRFLVQFAMTFDRDVGVLIDGNAEHSTVIALIKIS